MHIDGPAHLAIVGSRRPHPIRVLIVERMSLLRGALAAALSSEDDLDVAAAVGTVDEAVPVSRAVQPDVTVINIDLLAGAAASITERLAPARPPRGTPGLPHPHNRPAVAAARGNPGS